MQTLIADDKGTWYRNTSAYRMPDPESGTNFEPGLATKATATEWVKGQPHIEKIDDPFDTEPKTKKPEPEAKAGKK